MGRRPVLAEVDLDHLHAGATSPFRNPFRHRIGTPRGAGPPREFHVAIAVLEGLTEYRQQRQAPDPSVERMIDAGHEFRLRHRIFKTLDGTENLNRELDTVLVSTALAL